VRSNGSDFPVPSARAATGHPTREGPAGPVPTPGAHDLPRDWPLILAYHSVSDDRDDALAVHAHAFEAQLAWLRAHRYRSVTMRDLTSGSILPRERVVIVTFDDGYADNYTVALPILERHGFVATIYLVSDLVGTSHIHEWDVPKMTPRYGDAPFRLLTWPQVHEMTRRGIDFGSHTCTHPQLTRISPTQCRDEIVRSRLDLEDRLGREVSSFCYPQGDLDRDVVRMVEEAGYRCAVVTPPRAGIPRSMYALRRVGLYCHTTPLEFRLKMMPWVRRGHEQLKRLRASA
jgi:peptidoglycan/xylan/chitin deacetylase (PgdA/CDA1 family)